MTNGQFMDALVKQLPAFLVGGVIGTFFKGFTKEFFDERSRIAKHNRNVARHILKLCNEASSSNYHIKPRDMEDVHAAMNDLEGVNKSMNKHLISFVAQWQLIVIDYQARNTGINVERTIIETQNDIEHHYKILVDWANGLRA